MTRRRRYWSVVRTVAWRNLHIVTRAPALLLPPLAFPLFFYMAFAGGLSTVGGLPGFGYYNYDAFQFVFVLLQSAAFGGVFIGFSIGADFDSGFTRRLLLGARDRSAVIVGYGVAGLTRAVYRGADYPGSVGPGDLAALLLRALDAPRALAYGYLARIPVVVVMYVALQANWGTHFEKGMPGLPVMPFLQNWLVICVLPQFVSWIGFTLVIGGLCGGIAALFRRSSAPASESAS